MAWMLTDGDALTDGEAVDLVRRQQPWSVLLVPDAAPSSPGTRRLRRAVRLLGVHDVAVLPRPRTRTAVGLQLRLLDGLDVPAGALADALDVLADDVHTIALVGSLAGLAQPAPSLAQHVRGLLPGRRFGVDTAGEGAVVDGPERLRGRLAPPLAGVPASACASGQAERAWCEELARVAMVAAVEHLPPAQAPSRWGTSRWAELSYAVDGIGPLARRLRRGLGLRPCPSCGQQVGHAPCPWCGTTGEPAGDAPTERPAERPDHRHLPGHDAARPDGRLLKEADA